MIINSLKNFLVHSTTLVIMNCDTDNNNNRTNAPFHTLEIYEGEGDDEEEEKRERDFVPRSKFARQPSDSELSAMLPPTKRCIFSSKSWCIVISVVSAILVIGGMTAALTIAHV